MAAQRDRAATRRQRAPAALRAASWGLAAALLVSPARAAVGGNVPPTAPLGADEVIDRSVAAHGGLDAWRKINSLVWVGHIESERLSAETVKFSLEEVRPNKTRFDIISAHPSARVYNGSKGWKVHSRNDGPSEVESFSPLEERFEGEAARMGGPVLTFREQGDHFTLQGMDTIDGVECYRLGVTLRSGTQESIWVDAHTFLELRYDRPTYSRDGRQGMVSVYYRNYQAQGGLQLPTVVEIGAGTSGKPDRLVVERVAINPEIADTRFLRPPSPPHSHEVTLPPMAPAGMPRPAAVPRPQ